MLGFYDREAELSKLEELYISNRFKLVFIIGRRRVGKTRLILEFLKGKKAHYFMIKDASDVEIRADICRSLGMRLSGWEEIFSRIFSVKERSVFVFDEFQRAYKARKSVPSILQEFVDLHRNENVMLILSGSSVGLMRSIASGALGGRASAIITLKPFGFKSYFFFFPRLNFEKKLELYSIFGGTPRYIEIATENIKDPLKPFLPGNELYEEPKIVFTSEELESYLYFSICRAIASGLTKFGEIASAIGMKGKNLEFYLENLESRLNAIKRNQSLIKPTKKKLYLLNDPFFLFYFKFVDPVQEDLEAGNYGALYERWKKYGKYHISKVFEDVALEALSLAFPGWKTGRIWGNFGKEKEPVEIDAAALSPDKKELVVAEVKWQEKKLGKKELEELREKASLLGFEGKIKYLLIGKKVAKLSEPDAEAWDLRKLEQIFVV